MNWIKVSKRLPPKNTTVLIYRKDGGVIFDILVDEIIKTDVGYSWRNSYRTDVTHWMTVPKPPTL